MSGINAEDSVHIPLTDGSGVDVYLNGERMAFRDCYDDAIAVENPRFEQGVLIVRVTFWGGGVNVSAVHLDPAELFEKATIPCELAADEGDTKYFRPDHERYAFDIELRRVRGESA